MYHFPLILLENLKFLYVIRNIELLRKAVYGSMCRVLFSQKRRDSLMDTNMLPKYEEECKNILKDVGNKLKKLRADKNLTQSAFSVSDFKMELRQYQRLEYGEVNFSFVTIYKICQNFGIQPAELFKDIEIDLNKIK